MKSRMKRMLFISWSWIPIVSLHGFVCHQLGLETSQEFDQRVLGVQETARECRWVKVALETATFFEVVQLLMSLTSTALFIYAATKGFQHEQRNRRRPASPDGRTNSNFVLRFKSFKRIVKVILTVLVLDIIGTGFRINHRWRPQLALNQLVHLMRMLLVVVEAWTYGLSYPSVRSAIGKLFRVRPVRIGVQEQPAVRRPPRNVNGWLGIDIEQAVRF
ncbi:hypothetical protein FJT64_026140 [Amphibalanus amphitrite]|uniref:G-protein coupled receptors family 1 profile domain-containing protein n=1 Tax=Amphibalanus amphitrite TaxID=1232801 RepID=A0A6A4WHS9_AMPAM|nr:hypothetical protein FJT64_026140 [Amphibalanus amphitrite]